MASTSTLPKGVSSKIDLASKIDCQRIARLSPVPATKICFCEYVTNSGDLCAPQVVDDDSDHEDDNENNSNEASDVQVKKRRKAYGRVRYATVSHSSRQLPCHICNTVIADSKNLPRHILRKHREEYLAARRLDPKGVTGYLIEKAYGVFKKRRMASMFRASERVTSAPDPPMTEPIVIDDPEIPSPSISNDTTLTTTPFTEDDPPPPSHATTLETEAPSVPATSSQDVEESIYVPESAPCDDSLPGRDESITEVQVCSSPLTEQPVEPTPDSRESAGTAPENLVKDKSVLASILCEIKKLSTKIETTIQTCPSRKEVFKEIKLLEKRVSPKAIKARSISVSKKHSWLLQRNTTSGTRGFCSTCMQNKALALSMKGANKVLHWVESGVSLKNRWYLVERHANTAIHKMCTDAHSNREQLQHQFALATEKKNRLDDTLTRDMLVVVYHNLLMGHSHVAFQSQMNRMLPNMISTKDVFRHVDRNVHRKTAAAAVDTFFVVFKDFLCRYFKSPNTSSGRHRHFHISADKVTVDRTSRQVINIRFVDADGSPVVTNLSVDVIRNRASEADTVEGVTHESDAVGCLEHISDTLTSILGGLSPKLISTMCFSMSSDKEAVYSGLQAGVAARWRDKFHNDALLHLLDRPHKIELLFDSVLKSNQFPWAKQFLEIDIDKVVGAIGRSSKLMRLARRIDASFTALRRPVETRFVEYTVSSIASIIKQFGQIVMTIENDERQDSDPAKLCALEALCNIDFIPTALVLIYLLEIAKKVSKAGQKATYSLWDDHKASTACRQSLIDASENRKSNPHLRKHGAEFCRGRFNGFDFATVSTLASSHKRTTRSGDTYRSTLCESLNKAKERQVLAAKALLDRCDSYLDVTEIENLMRKVFDIGQYPIHDKASLTRFRNGDLREIVTYFCSRSNIRFPRKHTKACSHESVCRCVENQFSVFKERVATHIQLRSEWYTESSGVKVLEVTSVLRDFLSTSGELHADIPDIIELIEITVLMCRSQRH